MSFALKLISPPAIEPIALADMMNFSRIDSDADVITMATMITAARQEAEKITRRQLITATWELRLDKFPYSDLGYTSGSLHNYGRGIRNELIPGRGHTQAIYLPMPPLQSVITVKYLDTANIERTLVENTDYLIDIYSEPARITPNYGYVWPPTYLVMNAVRIQFIAGYGDDDTDVPESIRSWIKAMAGTLYENRETVFVAPNTVNMVKLDFLDGLLDNFRIFGIE